MPRPTLRQNPPSALPMLDITRTLLTQPQHNVNAAVGEEGRKKGLLRRRSRNYTRR